MHLLRDIDPDGVAQRKSRRMKRRVYISKVCVSSDQSHKRIIYRRGQITLGILTNTISWCSMDFTFMAV